MIHAGLPLIDVFKTQIERFCPNKMKQPKCAANRYRSYDGQCNNLEHPNWGATGATFRRLIPPAYADGTNKLSRLNYIFSSFKLKKSHPSNVNDWNLKKKNTGISLPRISVTGEQLPTARYISAFVHRDLGFHDHAVTMFLSSWGQLIDHDMASGAETKGSFLFLPPRFSLSLSLNKLYPSLDVFNFQV